jgi:hypothetical protein
MRFETRWPSLAACLLAWTAASCSRPTAPSPSGPATPADAIEGLFLSSGPSRVDGCLHNNVYAAFPTGSTVALVVASSVDDSGFAGLQQAVADVERVNAGRFRFVIRRTAETDPTPGRLEITSAHVPVARTQSACGNTLGCTRILTRDGGLLLSVQVLLVLGSPTVSTVHDFGHAIGLCHVNPQTMPAAIMSSPYGRDVQSRFSDIELEAMRAVYASTLEPGARRADFVRAGLLK